MPPTAKNIPSTKNPAALILLLAPSFRPTPVSFTAQQCSTLQAGLLQVTCRPQRHKYAPRRPCSHCRLVLRLPTRPAPGQCPGDASATAPPQHHKDNPKMISMISVAKSTNKHGSHYAWPGLCRLPCHWLGVSQTGCWMRESQTALMLTTTPGACNARPCCK
jgi:hypothetical protein